MAIPPRQTMRDHLIRDHGLQPHAVAVNVIDQHDAAHDIVFCTPDHRHPRG